MPREISFTDLPSGYALNSAKGGEPVKLRLREFVSSEDGDLLIGRLEGLPQSILSMLSEPGKPVFPSSVNTLVAIIRKDKTATVYLNEVEAQSLMRVKGKVEKGDAITTNRVLDIGRMRFTNVTIPSDAGIVFVFSVGWRKGFFYDLEPLHDEDGRPRQYDPEEVFGSLYSYLLFQERFKLDDAAWSAFFSQKWFPFAHLDNGIIREMISHVREGWQIDELLPKISANVLLLLRERPLSSFEQPYFTEHKDVFSTASERYLAGDHVSCTSILYPRIEGLLRSFLRTTGAGLSPSAKNLSQIAVEHNTSKRITSSLLLPARFKDYLDKVYFASFAPGTLPDVGRHSVAHGEARPDDFSLKSSTVAIMLIYQLSLFFSSGEKPLQSVANAN